MSTLRKISEVWNTVDPQRIAANMKPNEWRQSHQGIQAALSSIGLVLLTSKKELDDMEVPLKTNGSKLYIRRRVEVSRNGEILPGISIHSLLTGYKTCALKTKDEMKAIWAAQSAKMSIAQPKGIPCTNNAESKAIDDLDRLIGVSYHMHREPLIEHRSYDIAYSPIDACKADNVFIADQVKTGRVGTNCAVNFHANGGMLKVKDMIAILDKGSLTCIGLSRDGVVAVVWYFTATAIVILKTFKQDQTFRPRLHLKTVSNKTFTMAMQSELFRFEVRKSNEKSKVECDRLLQAKIGFLTTGTKNSLKFWNEDISQIPSKNHQVEQKSMELSRLACEANGANYTKPHGIMYGPIDFLINGTVRVQDKALDKGKVFGVRAIGRLPYNPDKLDVFQVTILADGVAYVMSMRIVNRDGTVISFQSVDTLMKETIRFGPQWQEQHKQFKHDLKTPEGTKSYVDACIAAGEIPPLTDRTFYTKMCDDNRNKIGSKRQLAEKKAKKSK